VIRPGTGKGQPSVVAAEAPHRARERGADEALFRVGVVKPAHLERDQARLAEIDRLLEAALGEVPEVEPAAVVARRHVVEIEAVLVAVRLTEL
jgi:hypothetical protein